MPFSLQVRIENRPFIVWELYSQRQYMNELALLHDLDGVFQALFSLLRMLEQSSVPQ